MYELKHISAGSLMRVLSVVLALMYLVFSIVSIATSSGELSLGESALSALVGIILAAAGGAVLGAFVAWFYNLTAKKWGGIHLDFLLVHEERHEAHEDAHHGGTVEVK